jgi:hypothetical protein
MSYEVKPGEIAIVLRPMEDTNGDWSGRLNTGLIFGPEKHEDAMRMALDIAITMAATERFLEDYPEFMEDYDYYKNLLLQEIFPDAHAAAVAEVEAEEVEADGGVAYEKHDNVIRLNRWTETKGNA